MQARSNAIVHTTQLFFLPQCPPHTLNCVLGLAGECGHLDFLFPLCRLRLMISPSPLNLSLADANCDHGLKMIR